MSSEDRRRLREGLAACKVGWGNIDEPPVPTDFGMAYLAERRYRLRAESQLKFAHKQLRWHERRRWQSTLVFWLSLAFIAVAWALLFTRWV